ncbi:MAG: Na+/H+ antiporter subunit D [Deltaproteobacteria bacterium]|nr:Na+/H+ antiporter subunit D [Deltaproteobacteria bacterium]MBI2210404.1 Na+/H+ antiporter subunit D [Deltaproteobacteria bacterium]MBI2347123.1 Na+/H+ antiporter subunit D [Deltaproteobacteria bacterium]MBI2991738.1 Na+/H+ antiporter subunit D [Deltaproteobacteria bacterium]MBI3060581.1 Na+/H+ antiporter subunit D [Deltaproteobacteria bacterium]
MKILLILPPLIPLTAAALSLLSWRWRSIQRVLAVAGTAGLLGTALALLDQVWRKGIQATQVGGWPAPFGITLVADLFSAIMVVLAGLTGLAVAVYSLASMDARREEHGYYPLMHTLLMGVCGAFLTGDLFNLYVWFEVMLMASFVLLALGGERAQMEGAIKYVTLNLISSALFLAAVGMLYGAAGTLNMADLARKLSHVAESGLVTTLALLFLVAFGIKAAVFPLFFWLPASYHTPPVAVSAIFAGLLTKVGVYALIRVFTLLFVQDVGFTHTLILVVAGLTMVTGVLGAIVQNEFRRILSFHIISQIGYMIMGLGLFTLPAVAGSVFYIVHHIIVKTNLFLVSGVARRLRGSYELKRLGGLYQACPGLSILFLIPALSLAGMPPLSGFFAKLSLVRAGLEGEQYAIVAAALGVSLLTLLSMTKIWAEAFWKEETKREPKQEAAIEPEPRASWSLLLWPIATLAALTVAMGVAAEPVFTLATRAAEQLMNPADYIRAVLGEGP